MGSCVDAEADGQPSSGATDDDTNVGSPVTGTCSGSDDEDGVTFASSPVAGSSASVDIVVASAACTLDAWLDFNGDGDFLDSDEQIFTDQALTVGTNTESFAVPSTATAGTTYSRFRCSTTTGLTSTGSASDGEVEDYQVTIVAATTTSTKGGDEDDDDDDDDDPPPTPTPTPIASAQSQEEVFMCWPWEVVIPKAGLPNNAVTSCQPSLGIELPAASSFMYLGHVTEVEVKDGTGSLVTEFDPPIEVCFNYTATELAAVGDDVNNFLIQTFRDGDWESLSTSPNGFNRVCAPVDHLTLFGLFDTGGSSDSTGSASDSTDDASDDPLAQVKYLPETGLREPIAPWASVVVGLSSVLVVLTAVLKVKSE